MALTPEGRDRATARLLEELQGARVRVTDGDSLTMVNATVREEDGTVVVAALFDGDEANFEWRERQVVLADGTVYDAEKEDFGRKASGSQWSVKVELVVNG